MIQDDDMHVKLPEQLEEYLQAMVATGLYGSTSEFIRELIRKHMEERLKLHNSSFYQAVRAGDESAMLAEKIPYTSSLMAEIKAEAKNNLRNNNPPQHIEALPR